MDRRSDIYIAWTNAVQPGAGRGADRTEELPVTIETVGDYGQTVN
jgi:hypothetical protein